MPAAVAAAAAATLRSDADADADATIGVDAQEELMLNFLEPIPQELALELPLECVGLTLCISGLVSSMAVLASNKPEVEAPDELLAADDMP